MICKLEIYNGELNLFPVVTNERVFAQITMGNIVKGQPGVTPHIDPLGTTIYNEYNLSLNLGETGIEVGMYGKSNYEEVISYDDLKSKLGL
jgi:hypothetical protein